MKLNYIKIGYYYCPNLYLEDKNNKKINPFEWIRRMNNYKNRIEEVIFKELIYV